LRSLIRQISNKMSDFQRGRYRGGSNGGAAEVVAAVVRNRYGGLDRPGGEVEPLLFAVAQATQADPVEHARLVAAHHEGGVRGRAIQEVDASDAAAAFKVEAADAVAGDASQRVLEAGQREADEIDQAFAVAGQVTAEAEQPLPVRAEGVEADGDGPA